MSRPLSLARVREAIRQNDREKLRQEFQETAPWLPPLPRPAADPAAGRSDEAGSDSGTGEAKTPR